MAGFSMGGEQFIKQARKQLVVCHCTMFLYIALFGRANRICVCTRFQPGGAVWLRVWVPHPPLDLLGRHNSLSESVTRSP